MLTNQYAPLLQRQLLSDDNRGMKFSCAASKFKTALGIASKVTPTSSSISSSSDVVIEALDSGEVRILASDGTVTIYLNLEAQVSTPGLVSLPPTSLLAYLSALPSSASVEAVAPPKSDLKIKSSSASSPYTFRVTSSNLIQSFPEPDISLAKDVDFSNIASIMNAIKSSVSPAQPDPRIISCPEGIFFHTTDTFRVSQVRIPGMGFGNFTGVIPMEVLELISKLNIKQVSIDPSPIPKKITFIAEEGKVTSRLLSSSFPAVENSLASLPPLSTQIPVTPFLDAIALLSVFNRSANVVLEIDQLQLKACINEADYGTGCEEIELPKQSPSPLRCALRLKFLKETLLALDTPKATLHWEAADRPLYFTTEKDNLLITLVIMPVLLS